MNIFGTKHTVFCLIIGLLLLSPFASAQQPQGTISYVSPTYYRDSIRTHILEMGSATMSCYLAYPIGESTIDPHFGNNAFELTVLRRFLHYALEDTLVCVFQVNIIGYSSIDGNAVVNERLALGRANRLLKMLDAQYGISNKYPVEIKGVGADWTKLRQLIEASSYRWKTDALRIIDGKANPEWKKLQLAQLSGGNAKDELYELYPQLRRVEIRIDYDVQCMKSKLHRAPLPDLNSYAVRVLKLKAMNTLPLPGRRPFRPCFALHTDLLATAGLTFGNTDIHRRAPMPNLSAEWFFARRWSVVASATYAYWGWDSRESFWGVSAYGLQPRLWLRGDRRFRGFYLGAYGRVGDFDIRHLENATGRYWQAGLSVGYYLPLSRHWGVGANVLGGYRHSESKYYDDNYYYQYGRTKNSFGLAGIELNIGYRFGR